MSRLVDWLERLVQGNRLGILLIFFLITLTGSVVGWKYYDYTRNDPQFCTTCHMMRDAYLSWQKSKHWEIKCQTCHRMSIFEQNRLLVAYVTNGSQGPIKERHGRTAPWNACRRCHLETAEQGSISVRRSVGHARHVFMENIPCQRCHSGEMHNFRPDEHACASCHKDKLVHGLGMEGLSCLKCHNYRENVKETVNMQRCLGCHKKVRPSGPMGGLKCFDCHKPHKQISLTSQDCLERCHGNEVEVGQHRLHMEKAGLKCLDCHRPHSWAVGPKNARALCTRCHPLKDPKRFLY